MQLEKPALPVFTSFRFFAAMAVVMHHLGFLRNHPRLKELYTNWLFEGFAGVTFFFILSGFILTYNYHDRFAVLKRRGLWDFYASRFARIYPVHILTFLVFFLTAPGLIATVTENPSRLLANLLLVQSFIPDMNYYFAHNAVAWSLSTEAFFYLLCPLLLWRFSRWTTIGVSGLLLAASAVWFVELSATLLLRDHPKSHWLLYINPLFRTNDFLIGMAIALGFARTDRERQRLISKTRATVLEMTTIVLLLTAVYFARYVPFPVRYGCYYTPFMALIVIAFALHRGYLSAILQWRALRFLGEISFSVYMFHTIVLSLLTSNQTAWGLGGIGTRGFVLVYIVAVLVVSAVCYCAFETPMRLGLKILLSPPTRQTGQGNNQPRLTIARAA